MICVVSITGINHSLLFSLPSLMPQGFFPSLLSILTDLLWIKEAVACGGTGRKEQHKMVRGLVSNGVQKSKILSVWMVII